MRYKHTTAHTPHTHRTHRTHTAHTPAHTTAHTTAHTPHTPHTQLGDLFPTANRLVLVNKSNVDCASLLLYYCCPIDVL